MKIAIVNDYLKAGGAERQCLYSSVVLTQHGEDVELIRFSPVNDYGDMLERHGVRTRCITNRGPMRLGRLRALTRHLRRGHFDVVHVFKDGVFGRLAAALAGVPCIFGGYRDQNPRGRLANFINRRLRGRMAGWITNSPGVKEAVIRDVGMDPDRIFVLPNAIYPENFRSPLTQREARAKFGVPPGAAVISIIANFRPMKNYDMFFRVADKLCRTGRRLQFFVAGQGDLAEHVAELKRRHDATDSVRILGRCQEIPELLRASDMLVLTSHARTEGLPNVLIEAGAAGLPSVATDCGAADVVIDGRTGYIVAPDDDEAMIARVGELLDDPDLRARVGTAAREHVERTYSPEGLYRNLMGIYRRGLEWSQSGRQGEPARDADE